MRTESKLPLLLEMEIMEVYDARDGCMIKVRRVWECVLPRMDGWGSPL